MARPFGSTKPKVCEQGAQAPAQVRGGRQEGLRVLQLGVHPAGGQDQGQVLGVAGREPHLGARLPDRCVQGAQGAPVTATE